MFQDVFAKCLREPLIGVLDTHHGGVFDAAALTAGHTSRATHGSRWPAKEQSQGKTAHHGDR